MVKLPTRFFVLTIAFAWAMVGISMASAPVPAGPTDEQLKETALKLNDLTGQDAMDARLKELIKDKDTAKRLVKIAAKLHADGKEKQPPFKFNAALVLAKVSHFVKEYDAAEIFYEFCAENARNLKSGQKLLQSYEGLMDLYTEQKKYQSVEKIAQQFLDTKGEKIDLASLLVMERMALAKAKQGDTDGALQLADNLSKLPQLGPYFLPAKAEIYREANNFEEAINTLEEFLDKADDLKAVFKDEAMIPRLKRNVRYRLSGIHVDNNDIDKAATQLQRLIKEDPENPTYYNDLGFVWADNGKKLEESEKLIRKALELDAKQREKLLKEGRIDEEMAKEESAAYLDSLGWVLFKLGKPKEALKYLEKASQDPDEGNHIEIWDHLAECYLALGQKEKALETWQKALRFEDISRRDLDRRKKVTEKINKLKEELKK